ncbi:hypothetical protein M408DRAFT_183436 [Serendipita vermifera MAFF 305830]|uniref:Uncharacterized protein n=1 Tax=Serendipita vermifera MAFF 305830 TaxID=933852 RepID=A0A0C3BKK2_SERVB|nr:hypothetical protein M408DRAFT_183436 [Serendipita vermifera MAFF 305830]
MMLVCPARSFAHSLRPPSLPLNTLYLLRIPHTHSLLPAILWLFIFDHRKLCLDLYLVCYDPLRVIGFTNRSSIITQNIRDIMM